MTIPPKTTSSGSSKNKPGTRTETPPPSEFDNFRNFLQTELDGNTSTGPRRVVALSTGLGLESPVKKTDTKIEMELAPGLPTQRETKQTHPVQPPPIRTGNPLSVDDLVRFDSPGKTQEPQKEYHPSSLRHSLEDLSPSLETILPQTIGVPEKSLAQTPPPLPPVTAAHRLFAAILDQLFVWTLFAVSLVLTANILTSFEAGFSLNVLYTLTDHSVLRLASAEFILLWLLYFGFTVGIGNRTYGMWTWGIKISYGDSRDENYLLRRFMRVFWSVVFFAPVVPLILLAIRKNGRNLLDTLSGSNLYGTT